MALRNCKECGKEISKRAKVCPSCGYRYGGLIGRVFKYSLLSIIGLFIFVSVIGKLLGGPISTATPTTASPTDRKWKTIRSWKGSGMKETESFTTSSSEWRIKWKASNEVLPGAGVLQLFVRDEGGTLVSLAANKQGPGEDESYVRGKPGRYYININSGNLNWEVAVEE